MVEWNGFFPSLCIAVDAESYGRNNDRGQTEVQHDLPRLLDRAARGAGLDRTEWLIQRKGDEQLAVRRQDGTDPRLVDDYIRYLAAELREHNARRVPTARLRLRAVIHQGLVAPADNGFAGTAVVVTARLLSARPLYDALADHPGSDLVLLLSDDVFRSLVAGGHTTLSPADFAPVPVEVKEYRGAAWLHVPGRGAPAAAHPPVTEGTQEPADPATRGRPEPTEPEADRDRRTAPSVPGPAFDQQFRATELKVTNVNGSVDARGAVFGFGSPRG